MAFDLLLQRETEADFSIHPAGTPEADRPMPIEFSGPERRALKLLEPGTAAFVIQLLSWARGKGIPARLSTETVIYTPEISARHWAEGRTSIEPGKIGWHHVGRAFHLVILNDRKQYDLPAYERVGRYARIQGGEWLGDKRIMTIKGPVFDTAHFEWHPGFDLGTYRKSAVAESEYRKAQARAKRQGIA
jgi:hypothetical protein